MQNLANFGISLIFYRNKDIAHVFKIIHILSKCSYSLPLQTMIGWFAVV